MKRTSSGYTGGEIAALIAPLFSIDADEIEHATVIIFSEDGVLAMVGCQHAEKLARMVVMESETHNRKAPDSDNPHSRNVGTINSRLARWARSWLDS